MVYFYGLATLQSAAAYGPYKGTTKALLANF